MAEATITSNGSMLSRTCVLQLEDAGRHFPQLDHEISTGPNAAASESASATRLVVYGSEDESKTVTVSVDRYATAADAERAYQAAVSGSAGVPGFEQLPFPSGEGWFLGRVTQQAETHVGLGLVHSHLVVGVTIAGYTGSDKEVELLAELARQQVALLNHPKVAE